MSELFFAKECQNGRHRTQRETQEEIQQRGQEPAKSHRSTENINEKCHSENEYLAYCSLL